MTDSPDTTKAPEGGFGSLRPSDCVPGEREATAKAILAAELKDEGRVHPSNRRRALRRRANKARSFPTNTCPASRHVHIMADELSTVGYYNMFDDEPLHAAGSLYAVVAALWEARTRIAAMEATTASAVGTEKPSGFAVNNENHEALREALQKATNQIAIWRSLNGDMVGAMAELDAECRAALQSKGGEP